MRKLCIQSVSDNNKQHQQIRKTEGRQRPQTTITDATVETSLYGKSFPSALPYRHQRVDHPMHSYARPSIVNMTLLRVCLQWTFTLHRRCIVYFHFSNPYCLRVGDYDQTLSHLRRNLFARD